MTTASILEGYTQLGKTCYLCHFIKEKRDTDTESVNGFTGLYIQAKDFCYVWEMQYNI